MLHHADDRILTILPECYIGKLDQVAIVIRNLFPTEDDVPQKKKQAPVIHVV